MSRVGGSHIFTIEVCDKCDNVIRATSVPVAPWKSRIMHTLLCFHGWCKCEKYYTYREDSGFLDLID